MHFIVLNSRLLMMLLKCKLVLNILNCNVCLLWLRLPDGCNRPKGNFQKENKQN